MDALEALAKWDRKFYRFTISTGRYIQPGDGMYVTLEGGGRKVTASEDEMNWGDDNEDENAPPKYVTLSDVIFEALRLWHSDPNPKNHRVILQVSLAEYKNPNNYNVREWGKDSVCVTLLARNEAEAEALAVGENVVTHKPSVCEVNANGYH